MCGLTVNTKIAQLREMGLCIEMDTDSSDDESDYECKYKKLKQSKKKK